jgi:hypothetical protein
LEARGFEKSTVQSKAFVESKLPNQVQAVYSRYVVLSGQVRHYWPKTILPKIQEVGVDITVEPSDGFVEIDWNSESIVFPKK